MTLMRSYNERREQLEAWARHDASIYRAFTSTIERVSGQPLRSQKVLDLGCGANAPMTLMLHAAGCEVTGADAHIGYRWGLGFEPSRYVSYLNEAGLGRTIRKLAGEIVFDRLYYQTLAASTGLPLTERGVSFLTLDVQNPTLPEGVFDIIHSNATWEHIPDVRAANQTLRKALKPGGIAYIEIHLFPSLSGGHDLPWIVPGRTLMGDVKPWRHLRDAGWEAPVYLNRHRERDYRAAFEETEELRILEWTTEFTEGEELLTPEIERELASYDRTELTRRSIIAVLQREA